MLKMNMNSTSTHRYTTLAIETETLPAQASKSSRHQPYVLVKRLLDLGFVFAVAPVVLPLSALVAILIWLDSPGPIFFAQQRLRLAGNHFNVWKFRTMCVDADTLLRHHLTADQLAREEWDHSHKLKQDPRITSIGKFLRSSSLDELPQFLNVLNGDMSIVGPRPIVQAEVARYGPHFSDYCRVKPGLTGLWQISGRSRLTFEQRVLLDREYTCACSLITDLKILAKTFVVVLRGDGAY